MVIIKKPIIYIICPAEISGLFVYLHFYNFIIVMNG